MLDANDSRPAVLEVTNLDVEVARTGTLVVRDLDFTIRQGEMLALVGESGSGKTMAARSIIQVLPPPLRIARGSIRLAGRELTTMSNKDLRGLRGASVGMVFQEPMVSLNPSMTIGRQMAEGLRLHTRLSDAEIRERCLAMLERVQIGDPERCLGAYPYQFSGGMRQRIMLASVMLLKPSVLIADEPTTALDTLVQREVLKLMVELCEEHDTAVLMISHDLGMVSHFVDRVVVMKDGEAVEKGLSRTVLSAPQHPYTRKLIEALPRRSAPRTIDRSGKPLLEVDTICVDYKRRGLFGQGVEKRAVHDVSVSVYPGETLAVVGGSGSGKTSLGRVIVGLQAPSAGEVRYNGDVVASSTHQPTRLQRLNLQLVFQDPYSSLNPRQNVAQIVGEPLRHNPALSPQERRDRVLEICDAVGLSKDFLARLPHELSGGQRQRVAIARAIVNRPAFIVADEPVSALDMTVQRQILLLVAELQRRFGFACIFISHDLGAVEQVADRVVVMENGRVVEEGLRDAVFDNPQHVYTRALLDAAMLLSQPESAELIANP